MPTSKLRALPQLKVLRVADRMAKPWKNGGGVMWDVAAAPDGADMYSFDWRVSIARIDESRPFSPFPEIDRHFAIIDGAGVVLTAEGVPHSIEKNDPALTFAGETEPQATLMAGSVLALNVMTRRPRFAAQMGYSSLSTETILSLPPQSVGNRCINLMVITEGKTRFGAAGNDLLEPHDAIIWTGSSDLLVRPKTRIAYWWIAISPALRGEGKDEN